MKRVGIDQEGKSVFENHGRFYRENSIAEVRNRVIAALGPEAIKALQESVDEMLASPQYRQYVQQAKLGLLDSRMVDIDKLIQLGVLKVDGRPVRGQA